MELKMFTYLLQHLLSISLFNYYHIHCISTATKCLSIIINPLVQKNCRKYNNFFYLWSIFTICFLYYQLYFHERYNNNVSNFIFRFVEPGFQKMIILPTVGKKGLLKRQNFSHRRPSSPYQQYQHLYTIHHQN